MNKPKVFEWLCIAIVYTIYLWPSANAALIILLVAFWLFFLKKSAPNKFAILFASLYLVSLVGLAYTSNMEDGLFRLQQRSAILFFPLVFGTIKVEDGFYKSISLHFIIATCVAACISIFTGIVNFIQTHDAAMMAKENLMVFRDLNPPMTGVLCITAIIILLSDYINSSKTRIFSACAVAFLSAYIILLSVRLEIAFTFLLITAFIFRYVPSNFYRVVLAGAFVFAAIISINFIPTLNRQWKELIDFSPKSEIVLDKDSSLGRSWGGKSIRIAIWQCSKDILRDHWLTGVGTGDVQDTLQATYERRKFYFASHYNKYNAHNQYIQTWLETGIFGLLVYVLCLVAPLVASIKKRIGTRYLLFLCLVIVMSFTESFLNVNKGIVWYSFFNSIFALTLYRERANNLKYDREPE